MNGSEQAKHRLLSHTRARHGSWRACASDALQAARVASEGRGRNDLLLLLLTAPTCVLAIYAAASACGIALCAARRRKSISRASNASAHCAYAAGRWQSTAAHRLWRLVCHRQCCQSLTCVLEPQQAAAAAAAAACCCLIQSSQRRSEACRIRAVWYLLRLSAFRPGDRSWMVRWSSPSSIEPSMAGRWSVMW